MRRSLRPASLVAAVAWGAIWVTLSAAERQDVRPADLDAVLDRAADYVTSLGRDLSTVLADEDYHQTYRADGDAPIVERRLRSEFALVRVADREEWVGFRDVRAVDGRPVHDRSDRLARLFLSLPRDALARGRTIADESARLNLGPVVRNLNVPTAALFFLHRANAWRFRFDEGESWCGTDRSLCEVRYHERYRPTLARTPAGVSVPMRGSVWIDRASGHVARTELRAHVDDRPLTVRIVVRWAHEPNLDVWVPVEMQETYDGPNGELTTGTATYRRFRRFRVETRVIMGRDSTSSDASTASPGS